MKKIVITTLLISLFVLYQIIGNHSASTINATDLVPFDKIGFVDSTLLSNNEKIVTENNDFILYLDETTSYFKVVDKRNNTIWYSNPTTDDPWVTDPNKTITNSAIYKQKSTIELSYYNQKGSIKTINNYLYSIHHPASILNDEGERTFDIKYLDNGFQVLYRIEDLEIDYLYFPKYLPSDVMEQLDDKEMLKVIAYTGYDEERDLYEIVQYETMSRLVKKRLYDVFYGDDGLGYTRERAIAENTIYGYTESFEKVHFEIGIQVLLKEQGIKITVIHDSIKEPENVKLASLSIYPLFGTASTNDDGYIVLPDGSGAIMNFNNGKQNQQPYFKYLYGQDIALLPHKMEETQEKISIPLYGMVKEGSGGFAAIITKGDAMAGLYADTSQRIDSYNKVYPMFWFRTMESVTLGSGFSSYGIDLWTKEIVNCDFELTYTFFTDHENGYETIASIYQQYLIDEGLVKHDNTKSTVLTLELIGVFDQKQLFLGIPYTKKEAMTSFKEAEEIISTLKEMDINNINVVYLGMVNGGLTNELNDEFEIVDALGKKKDYEHFITFLQENNIDLYPMISLLTANDFDKYIEGYKYVSKRLDGSRSILYNYHLPSKLPYNETSFGFNGLEYVVSPKYIKSLYLGIMKKYDNNLGFIHLGSQLSGDYDDDLIYREDAKYFQKDLLSSMEHDVALQNPLGFAMPYASEILSLSDKTTLYAILDYQVPLLQLVLSGYVDYSSGSMNLSDDRSYQYKFLKLLETGSNVQFTISYENSSLLKETPYNMYFSTQYENWLEDIKEITTTLDELRIHEGYLIHHEIVTDNVVRVEYSTGLILVINYNLHEVNVNGVVISALDYIVEAD